MLKWDTDSKATLVTQKDMETIVSIVTMNQEATKQIPLHSL